MNSSSHSRTDSETSSLESSDLNTKRQISKDEKSKIQKSNKKEKKGKKLLKVTKISMADYCNKQHEFKMWLLEEKNLVFDQMSSPSGRTFFKTFVKKWNSKKLSLNYYNGINVMDSLTTHVHPHWKLDFTSPNLAATNSFLDSSTAAVDLSNFSTFGKSPLTTPCNTPVNTPLKSTKTPKVIRVSPIRLPTLDENQKQSDSPYLNLDNVKRNKINTEMQTYENVISVPSIYENITVDSDYVQPDFYLIAERNPPSTPDKKLLSPECKVLSPDVIDRQQKIKLMDEVLKELTPKLSNKKRSMKLGVSAIKKMKNYSEDDIQEEVVDIKKLKRNNEMLSEQGSPSNSNERIELEKLPQEPSQETMRELSHKIMIKLNQKFNKQPPPLPIKAANALIQEKILNYQDERKPFQEININRNVLSSIISEPSQSKSVKELGQQINAQLHHCLPGSNLMKKEIMHGECNKSQSEQNGFQTIPTKSITAIFPRNNLKDTTMLYQQNVSKENVSQLSKTSKESATTTRTVKHSEQSNIQVLLELSKTTNPTFIAKVPKETSV